MDEDRNGTLSESELGDAMTALGVSYNDDELAAIMKEIDTNGKMSLVVRKPVFGVSD